MIKKAVVTSLVAALGLVAGSAAAQQELNIYSARHYQTDEALYGNFTKQTGIKINRIEAKEDELLERLRNEGANSPADILITVDASRLAKADDMGLFAPVESAVLAERIPAHLRTNTWIAFSTRARVIVYNKDMVKAEQVQNYEDLAKPELKGKVCTRSGSHPYNLSLGAALIQHNGAEKTEEWARNLVANFARNPRGGDTDQIRAVAAGECGVAIANSYYMARILKSDKPEDKAVAEKVKVVFPNQATSGTHVNIAGAAVAKHSKNRDNAIAFMEYLASPAAQRYFADGNNEFAAAKDVKLDNPALKAMGGEHFKAEQIPLEVVARNLTKVQQMLDRAGYK